MAFQEAEGSHKASIKANQLEVGQYVEGFIIGKEDSDKFQGSFAFKFIPKVANEFLGLVAGEEILLWANGSLRKFYEAGNEDGYLYRITRIAGVMSKTFHKETVSFSVQVDKDQKYIP